MMGTKTQSLPARDVQFGRRGTPVGSGETRGCLQGREPARPGIRDGSLVSLGQGPHPNCGAWGAGNPTPWGSLPPKLAPGQRRGRRANGELSTVWRLLRVPRSGLSALSKSKVQGPGAASLRCLPSPRGASGRAPLGSIIYSTDRSPTLISRMGIWDTGSQADLVLCQRSTQRGASRTRHTGHGRRETRIRRWRPMSLVQPPGEAAGADQLTSHVNVTQVPTC